MGQLGGQLLILWRHRPGTAPAKGAWSRLNRAVIPGWDGSYTVNYLPVKPLELAVFMQSLADRHAPGALSS